MNETRAQRMQGERGASLLLVIVFMLVIGAISGAVISSVSSGVSSYSALEKSRNRQYAADGGIETAISQVRKLTASPGIGFANCAPAAGYYSSSLNGVNVRVDCQNAPSLTQGGFLQRNVTFTACESAGAGTPCTAATTIVRAQVNFQAITLANGSLQVNATTVQSWSVNR